MTRNIYVKHIGFLGVKNSLNLFLTAIVFSLLVFPNYAANDKTKSSKIRNREIVSKKNESNSPKRKPGSKTEKPKATANTEAGKIKSNSAAEIRARYLFNKPLNKFTGEDKKQNRRYLENLRRKPATQRFFTVVQEGEGGNPKIMVGNRCPKLTDKLDLTKHPGEVLPSRCFYWYVNRKGKLVFSTASGNYQITRDNYRKIAPFLDIKDFKVLSQQLIALELMRRGSQRTKSALIDLERGNARKALCLGTEPWASSKCSTLEASQKKDYQKIYDRQMREAGNRPSRRKNSPEREPVKVAGDGNKNLKSKVKDRTTTKKTAAKNKPKK